MLRAPAPLLLLFALACAPNDRILVIVTVDTLRADHVGAYEGPSGSPRDLTPNIDALAARSTQFEAAYAPIAFTLPSIGTLLTGRHPLEIGLLGNFDRLPADVPTLATLLRDRGFRTGAVVSNYVLRSAAGLDRTFDIYDDEMLQREAVRPYPERVADHTTNAALATLDRLRADGPHDTLLWVHYQDPHGPYSPPDGFRERYLMRELERPGGLRMLKPREDNRGVGGIPAYQYLGRNEVGFYWAGYAGEVRFTDEQIGRLFAGLDERGLFERAVILFAGDHGEALGERDYWFAHGEELTDPLVRIPLLLRVPGRPYALRRDVVGLPDILPTLLSVLGVEVPGWATGRDLLASPDDASTILLMGASPTDRSGIVTDGHKLILTPGDPWQRELYELGREGVSDDRNGALPEVAATLQQRLTALWTNIPQRTPLSQPDLAAERARLEALGYSDDP